MPQPVSQENFIQFGALLSGNKLDAIAAGEEFSFTLTASEIALAPLCCTGVLRCAPRALQVNKMERHTDSSEILVALDGDFYLVLAPAEDDLKSNEHIETFILKQGQAIVMKPGTWHWIPFPVEEAECRVMVLFKDGTGDNDLHFNELSTPYHLNV